MKNETLSLPLSQIHSLQWAAKNAVDTALNSACKAQDKGDEASARFWARIATDLQKTLENIEKQINK